MCSFGCCGILAVMSKQVLFISLVLYMVSAVGSFAAFSLLGQHQPISVSIPTSETGEEEPSALAALLQIDPKAPVDQPCPLNGKMYTAVEHQAWEQRRPLAVMIENAPDARPQSGLSDADIVFEIMAEGGVTRFMPIFYCGAQKFDTTLAPVRSARYYFVSYAQGFNQPLYAHVGGSNLAQGKDFTTDALGYLSYIGWVGENDLNQFSIGYPTFVRDYNRLGTDREIATEHTMVSSTEKLWAEAADRDWTNLSPERKIGKTITPAENWQDGYQGWSFQTEVPTLGNVTSISYEFWTGFSEYAVSWQYDPTTNTYRRVMAGEPHIDLNNDRQITASNVIVLLTTEKGPVNEKKHMVYQTTGTGDALIFNNGAVVEATWAKKDHESELTFTAKGKPVELARGLTWISVVDKSTDVEY